MSHLYIGKNTHRLPCIRVCWFCLFLWHWKCCTTTKSSMAIAFRTQWMKNEVRSMPYAYLLSRCHSNKTKWRLNECPDIKVYCCRVIRKGWCDRNCSWVQRISKEYGDMSIAVKLSPNTCPIGDVSNVVSHSCAQKSLKNALGYGTTVKLGVGSKYFLASLSLSCMSSFAIQLPWHKLICHSNNVNIYKIYIPYPFDKSY